MQVPIPAPQLPEGAIPVSAIVVVRYLDANGDEALATSWEELESVLVGFGMLELAKGSLEEAFAGGDADG